MNPNEKIELNFEPINEGLGFHPFSDGLPYAPVSKSPAKNYSRGTGAVAAGPAQYVRPQAIVAQPKVSVPVAKGVQSHVKTALPEEKPLAQKIEPVTDLGIPYCIKRILAYSIDLVIHSTLCLSALWASVSWQNLSIDQLFASETGFFVLLFIAFFHWSCAVAQEIAFGTTVGKHLCRLRIEGAPTQLIMRAFFFIPSLGLGGLGIVWGLFGKNKRCWHDWVADVQPLPIRNSQL